MTERQDLLDFPGTEALQAAGHVEPPSPQALARATAAVRAAAQDEAVVTPLRRRRLASGRRIVATVLVAAACAATVVVYTNQGTGSPAAQAPQQAKTVSAATFLTDTAAVAAARPMSSGQYWKVHMKVTYGKPSTWHGKSGTFDEYISRSGYTIVDGGRTFKKPNSGWRLGPKTFDWNGLDQLPTDPAKLLEIMDSSKEYAGQSAFLQASSLLGESPASPQLRAALFKALAGMNGVKLVGNVKDSAGREGTELAFDGIPSSDRVIVDPKTSLLLEATQTSTKGHDLGLIDRRTYLSVGPAEKIG
ncbi:MULTISPECIES: CU044_5270 family protein [unclassified Streptomyces]|uniref:CU044_5270 family protein n=1 Tax=unclassified Streptomyces TaxID=2593676 RepID=UPI0035DC3D95